MTPNLSDPSAGGCPAAPPLLSCGAQAQERFSPLRARPADRRSSTEWSPCLTTPPAQTSQIHPGRFNAYARTPRSAFLLLQVSDFVPSNSNRCRRAERIRPIMIAARQWSAAVRVAGALSAGHQGAGSTGRSWSTSRRQAARDARPTRRPSFTIFARSSTADKKRERPATIQGGRRPIRRARASWI